MSDANELLTLLTPSQAARLAEVSESLVRAWIREGRLPVVQTPYGRLIYRQAVERLVEERRKRQQQGK